MTSQSQNISLPAKPPLLSSLMLPQTSQAILGHSYPNSPQKLSQGYNQKGSNELQNSPQEVELKLEVDILRQKYSEVVGRLSAVPHDARVHNLEKELAREKDKALKVILKLERDLEVQEKRFEYDKLKFTSQIESLIAMNQQLQSELTNAIQQQQRDNELILKEKEDAEQVVQQLRQQNEMFRAFNDKNNSKQSLLQEFNSQVISKEQLNSNDGSVKKMGKANKGSSLNVTKSEYENEKAEMKGQIQLLTMEKNDMLSVLENLRLQLSLVNSANKEATNNFSIQRDSLLQEENKKLDNQLGLSENRVRQLSNDLENLREELQQKDQQIADKIMEINSLKGELAEQINSQLNMISNINQLEKIKDQLKTSQSEVRSWERRYGEKESELDERKNEIQQLRLQLQTGVEERQSILERHEQAVAVSSYHSQTVITNNQENAKLKDRIRALEEQAFNSSALSTRDITQMKSELDSSRLEVNMKINQLEELKNKIVKMNKEWSEQRERNKIEVDQLNGQLRQSIQDADHYKQIYSRSEMQNRELQDKFSANKFQNQQMNDKFQDQLQQLNEFIKREESYIKQAALLEGKLNQLQSLLFSEKKRNDEAASSYKDSQYQQSQLNSKYQEISNKYSEAESKYFGVFSKLEQLQVEFNDLQAKYDQVQQRLESANRQTQEHASKFCEVQLKYYDSNKQYQEIHFRFQENQQKLQELNSRLSQSNQQCEEMNRKYTESNYKYEETRKSNFELSTKLSELNKQLDEVRLLNTSTQSQKQKEYQDVLKLYSEIAVKNDQLQKKLVDLSQEITKLNLDKSSLEVEKKNLIKDKGDLEQRIQKQMREIQNIQQQQQQDQTNLILSQQQKESIKQQLKSEKDKYQLLVSNQNSESNELQQELKIHLDNAEVQLTKIVHDKDYIIQRLQSQIDKLKENEKSIKESEDAFKREIDSYKKQIEVLKVNEAIIANNLKGIEKDLNAFKELSEQREKQLLKKEEDNQNLLKQFQQIEQKLRLQKKQEEVDVYEESIKKNKKQSNDQEGKCSEELKSLKKQLKDKSMINLQMQQELNAVKKELDKSYDLIESKKQECDILNKNYILLKEELTRLTQQQNFDTSLDGEGEATYNSKQDEVQLNSVKETTDNQLNLKIVDMTPEKQEEVVTIKQKEQFKISSQQTLQQGDATVKQLPRFPLIENTLTYRSLPNHVFLEPRSFITPQIIPHYSVVPIYRYNK